MIREYPLNELDCSCNKDLLGFDDCQVVALVLLQNKVQIQILLCQSFDIPIFEVQSLSEDLIFWDIHDLEYVTHKERSHVRIFGDLKFFTLFLLELIFDLFFDGLLKRVKEMNVKHIQVGSRLQISSVLDDHNREKQEANSLDSFLC